MLPPLLKLKNESEYKNYYIENYCNKEIKTHDGIVVKFFEDRFEHSFYKRTKKTWKSKKDIFSQERGERMDWIKYVLNDPTITPKKGYDKATQSYDSTSRVAFLNSENYLVVIYINQNGEGKFITAYLVDNENAADKIRNSPNWE